MVAPPTPRPQIKGTRYRVKGTRQGFGGAPRRKGTSQGFGGTAPVGFVGQYSLFLGLLHGRCLMTVFLLDNRLAVVGTDSRIAD